jgi:ribosome-binding protein aMBF1 (putative translation factor)
MSSGQSLYDARKASGMSRERVAASLKPPVSTKTIERWEGTNAIARNRRQRLNQLAKLYGVDVADLTNGEG